jgi:putative DNA primase/helicase
MTDITHIFGGEWSPKTVYIDPVEVQIEQAMKAAGIEPPADIKIDGQLHRFSTKGRKKDDSGWYVFFPEEPVAGRFGCWRDNLDSTFCSKIGRDLTAAEHMAITRRNAEAQARRDEARTRKHKIAASTVELIWTDAGQASPDHPYLTRKGIKPHGIRITGDGRLIAPLYGDDGISSLQYIDSEGEKKYHPGGEAKGKYWMIGDLDGPLFIAEGFATAATIHEATDFAVAIAFSAGNLVSVTGTMREKYGPQQEIIIVADNDESGVGVNSAEQASAKHGGRIVCPPIKGDANDYVQAGFDLKELLFPHIEEWLIPADDFSSQPAPINWLVKHWVQQNALVMVHGPSGGGKTFIVLDLLLHVASGALKWFNHNVNPGAVVYLAGEGHHGLRGRIAAWKQHNGVTSLDMWLSKAGCDLNTPSGYQKVAEAIRALPHPPSVIAVDTLHRFLDGDENSAQDAKTMLDACAGIMSEFDCTVILVHHTGVSDEAQHRARGSSAWKGALDIEISVVPAKGDGSIQIVQRKSKDAEEAAPIWVDLQSVPIAGWLDEDNEQVTSAVVVQGTETKSSEKASPASKHQKLFERAWFATGASIVNGSPFLRRNDFIDWMISENFSKGTAENYTKPSYANGMARMLQDAEIIAPEGDGWIVINDVFASTLMVRK